MGETRVIGQEEKLIVFFPDEGHAKVGVKPIRILAEAMEEKDIGKAILVLKMPLTSFAKRAVVEASSKIRIDVFQETELIFNITHHTLVPKHVPLTEAEKAQLLNRYKMKLSQLPRIQQSDPISRYFGLQKDQVVKIIRPSETTERYVTYRVVV